MGAFTAATQDAPQRRFPKRNRKRGEILAQILATFMTGKNEKIARSRGGIKFRAARAKYAIYP